MQKKYALLKSEYFFAGCRSSVGIPAKSGWKIFSDITSLLAQTNQHSQCSLTFTKRLLVSLLPVVRSSRETACRAGSQSQISYRWPLLLRCLDSLNHRWMRPFSTLQLTHSRFRLCEWLSFRRIRLRTAIGVVIQRSILTRRNSQDNYWLDIVPFYLFTTVGILFAQKPTVKSLSFSSDMPWHSAESMDRRAAVYRLESSWEGGRGGGVWSLGMALDRGQKQISQFNIIQYIIIYL